MNGQEIKNLDLDKYRDVWDSLSEDDKWESYKIAYQSYNDLYKLYQNMSTRETTLINDLEKSNELLKKKFVKYGIGLFVLGGLTQELRADVYTGINFDFFFLNGRVAISPMLAVKIYDKLGGSLGISFKFCW